MSTKTNAHTPLTDAEIRRIFEVCRVGDDAQKLYMLADFTRLLETRLAAFELARKEAEDNYTTLTGLLHKRFPPPDGVMPDYKVEDVLRENDALRLEVEQGKEQWRMSSVCREKQAEIEALQAQLLAADGLADATAHYMTFSSIDGKPERKTARDAVSAFLSAYQSARQARQGQGGEAFEKAPQAKS